MRDVQRKLQIFFPWSLLLKNRGSNGKLTFLLNIKLIKTKFELCMDTSSIVAIHIHIIVISTNLSVRVVFLLFPEPFLN